MLTQPILFIAPFESMARTAAKVIREMGLEFPIVVGNNEQAVRLARLYPDIKVIITRGGTAGDVKHMPNKAIVEITTTVSDLMPIIQRFAESGFNKIGVVTRSNIIDEVILDFTFGDLGVYMRPCLDDKDIEMYICQLKEMGIEAVVGCKLATVIARQKNLAAELLDSGTVSIKKAVNEAVNILKAQEFERMRLAQLNAVIDNISEGIIIVNREHDINFYNILARKIFADGNGIIHYSDVKELLSCGKEEQVVAIRNTKLLVRCIPLFYSDAQKGGVITFREVSSIEDSERKVRLSAYKKGLYAKKSFSDIIYRSSDMGQVVGKAMKYARTNSNILIYGETGTGKEIIAQSIHNASNRQGPFVSVNCASIPVSIMESELFGYVEGAFTGASKGGKPGLFELAHEGTIFLDEIGELSLDIQSRLLRVLQEREIMRLGDDRIIPVDVRVICATNKDLFALACEGKFREDLYYRIAVLKLQLPPLRERQDDIPLLFYFYHKQFNGDNPKNKTVSPAAMKRLSEYGWPGNIRELRNVAEVLALTDDDVIDASHVDELLTSSIKPKRRQGSIIVGDNLSLKAIETEVVNQLLDRYSTDEVCRRLAISRTSLWRKSHRCFKNETCETEK